MHIGDVALQSLLEVIAKREKRAASSMGSRVLAIWTFDAAGGRSLSGDGETEESDKRLEGHWIDCG